MLLFDKRVTAGICLKTDAQAVRLAAADLQRDLRRLSGQEGGFPFSAVGEIEIRTCSGEPESYTVEIGDRVVITGADVLGTIYGIYAFADRCLGILPVHRLVDVFPPTVERKELPACSFASGKRAVRWRGWFLNDEDLLSELVCGGGKRHIDYPYYQDVMDTAVLDMVLETALRLEINLVIPASFLDILNPDEKKLADAVCRRGLYISQHHVEPVGVSFFAADAYVRKYGVPGEAVSFVSNRGRMEEIWQTYIRAWAAYGTQVIWQLGLRGKGDEAVWKADPAAPMTDEARGALITDAITTQHRMIREAVGEGFVSTATLWNEGSILYGKGFLQLPEGTVAIFADFGISQLFGADFYTMPRLPGKQYGVYYHSAFWALGPHLTEGCRPRKMVYSLQQAASRESLHYAILNVSNVRPVHYAAMVFSEILRDPENADAERITRQLDTKLFGDAAEQIHGLRGAYYDAFADFGRDVLRSTAEKWQFFYQDHSGLPLTENAVTDGYLAKYTQATLRGRQCSAHPDSGLARRALLISEEKFASLWKALCSPELPQSPYLEQFLKYQTLHMLLLTRCALAVMDMTAGKEDAKETACAALEQLLEARKVLEQGHWKQWHKGDKKINLPLLLQLTKAWKPNKEE